MYLRQATAESNETFVEMPLYQLREQYEKTEVGKQFLKTAILDRRYAACLVSNYLVESWSAACYLPLQFKNSAAVHIHSNQRMRRCAFTKCTSPTSSSATRKKYDLYILGIHTYTCKHCVLI